MIKGAQEHKIGLSDYHLQEMVWMLTIQEEMRMWGEKYDERRYERGGRMDQLESDAHSYLWGL